MKKTKNRRDKAHGPGARKLLIMKVTFIFTCCFILNLSAAVKGQFITLKMKGASLVEVMRELKRQSGQEFFYSHEELRAGEARDVNVNEATLDDALRVILGEGFTWERLDEIVIIRPERLAGKKLQRPDGKISGRVTDESGAPLPGASIVVKGTTTGVTTDVDGNFTLDGISGSVVLRVTHVGMEAREIEARENARVEVTLENAIGEVEQVVVTGYQTIAREKSTGAVTAITARQLDERYTPNIQANLEGRVAGLVIHDGEMTIRGASSLHAATRPLLVIDGLPVEGSIDDVNPNDVESI
ncbi:MAG: carboxypeptidase-like regulatory domain-containing protein, partial [Odoribacteraceae bacterium]|nr:carboxypeptidase-like regulatory domain-containing protein [Odoribacteraceae bacterium]